MSSPKSVPVTVHLQPALAEKIEARAAEDRRPVSQYLRLVIEDALAGKSVAA
jgi:Ribbon-helix-helix protein, copG family